MTLGDPVIQLQAAFGGGKPHTMLAVFPILSWRHCRNRTSKPEANVESHTLHEGGRKHLAREVLR